MSIEHDGAASLAVRYLKAAQGGVGGRDSHAGWYVVRTCLCHQDETITVPFEGRELAENALRALDEDARKYG